MYCTRTIGKNIQQALIEGQGVVLAGPPQVGRTRLLKRLEREAAKRGGAHYLGLENPQVLEPLNESASNLFKLIPKRGGGRKALFIDDLHYLDDPAGFLLSIISHNPSLKVAVSISGGGSSLKHSTKIRGLPVRFFALGPLSFSEFVHARNRELSVLLSNGAKDARESRRDEIEEYCREYVRFGGYPSVVHEKNPARKQALLQEIVNAVLNHHVRRSGIRDSLKVFKLLKILAGRVGEPVNVSELAASLDLSNPTVESHLGILLESMKIRFVEPYRRRHPKEIGKMRKFYFTDLGVRNAVLDNFDSLGERWDRERYFENVVYCFLASKQETHRIHFWRTQNKNEVDFIVNERRAFDTRFCFTRVHAGRFRLFERLYPEMELKRVAWDRSGNGCLGVLDI